MLDIIIGLISGAVGGNVAGAAMKENSLGTIGNSIARNFHSGAQSSREVFDLIVGLRVG